MNEEKNLNEIQENAKSENAEEVNENILQEEIITQPETQNIKPQTENMEVHHHPRVAKKKFKEYFLEFLMIFLAVILGFLPKHIIT